MIEPVRKQPMLQDVKTIVEIVFYMVAIVGGLLAVRTYRQNQSLERSRWASSLYEKFYEKFDLKGVRRILDCSANAKEVEDFVKGEPPELTDYLNFFEHVAYLVRQNQVRRSDAEAYFDYYFSCLKRHPSVLRYVQDKSNGYEYLAEFLKQ
jgi:hypothetical protein